jgi:hypothetical protein
MRGRPIKAPDRLSCVFHQPSRLDRPLVLAIILVSLLTGVLSACTYEEPEGAPSISAVSDQPSASSSCQEGVSAYCLGLIDPGTYSTKVFQPELSFTVPEGWTNVQDEPGNLLLNRRDDPQDGRWGGSYIGVYQNVRAASLCKEEVEPGIGTSSSDLAAWYRSVPGLEIVGEAPASVGGLTGITLDFRVRDDWKSTCPPFGFTEFIPVIIGGGVSQLHHVVAAPLEMRLFVLDWEGGNVAVEVTAVRGQHSLADYLEGVGAGAVIDSFKFAS